MTARADLLADMLDMARDLVADLEAMLRDELGEPEPEADPAPVETSPVEMPRPAAPLTGYDVGGGPTAPPTGFSSAMPPPVDRQLARARMAVARVNGERA